MRCLLVILLLLPLGVARADEIDDRIAQLERDTVGLRSETERVKLKTRELAAVLAETDRRIARQRDADRTALGATRIENLRRVRAGLEDRRRLARRALSDRYERLEAQVTALENRESPRAGAPFESVLARARQGDTAARAELQKIRARVVKEVAGIQQSAIMLGQQQFAPWGLGGGKMVIRGQVLINGRFFTSGGVAPSAPAKPAQPKRPRTPEEIRKAAAEDLSQQQDRARALQARAARLAKKIAALEEQLWQKRANVAVAPGR